MILDDILRTVLILIQLESFDFKNRIFECTSARKRMKQINFENGSSHGLLTPYYMKRYCILKKSYCGIILGNKAD